MAVDFSDLITAVIGGIIGALAGGVPAYLIARSQAKEFLERDAASKTREEKARGLTASVKVLQISNSIFALRKHVEACLLRTEGESEAMEPWQRLIPMVGHTDERSIRFNDDEIVLIARTKQSQLMQDMLLLANRHAASLEAWRVYCERRDQLNERLPKPTHFEGDRGSATITEKELMELMPYTIPLNNLTLSLRVGLAEDAALAIKVMTELSPALADYFKAAQFVPMVPPTDEEFRKEVEKHAKTIGTRGKPPL